MKAVAGLLAGLFLALPTRTPRSGNLSIAFLYDLTISVTRSPVGSDRQLKRTLEALTMALRRGDGLRFGIVARRPYLSDRVVSDGALDVSQLVPDVPDDDRRGPSPLWDALDAAVTRLDADPLPRAVVLVTDGRSTGNVRGIGQALAHAQAVGVSISAMVIPIPIPTIVLTAPPTGGRGQTDKPLPDPAKTLATLADETGGMCQYWGGGACGKPKRGASVDLTSLMATMLERARK